MLNINLLSGLIAYDAPTAAIPNPATFKKSLLDIVNCPSSFLLSVKAYNVHMFFVIIFFCTCIPFFLCKLDKFIKFPHNYITMYLQEIHHV